jgi:spore coat protein CotF
MTNKKQQNVDEALASFRNEGLEVDAYLQSQLNEYLAGRMTKKMMLQMVDEAYLEGKNDLLRYG